MREDLKAEAPENKKDIPWRELFEKLYGRSPDTCPKALMKNKVDNLGLIIFSFGKAKKVSIALAM